MKILGLEFQTRRKINQLSSGEIIDAIGHFVKVVRNFEITPKYINYFLKSIDLVMECPAATVNHKFSEHY